MHTDYLGILLPCRFLLRGFGIGLRCCLLASSPGNLDVASPSTIPSSKVMECSIKRFSIPLSVHYKRWGIFWFFFLIICLGSTSDQLNQISGINVLGDIIIFVKNSLDHSHVWTVLRTTTLVSKLRSSILCLHLLYLLSF